MVSKKRSENIDPKMLAKTINAKFGPNTIRMGNDPYFQIERIPTGILSLDIALGGGFPRGRHVEIYGTYAVGKSFTAYKTIASAQQLGYRCAFVDCERTLDPEFAANAGVDINTLEIHEQEHGNRVINVMETWLRAGHYGIIVLDSIAALLPKAEQERDMEQGTMGTAQAKLMSEALRRLTAANTQKTLLIYINQLRDAIGVMFGKRSVTSGGRAMSFYASTRLEMTKTEIIKKKKKIIDPNKGDEIKKDIVSGHRVLVRVDKEKSGGSHAGLVTTFVFDYETAMVDHIEDLLYLGRTFGLVKKSGNKWWVDEYEEEKQLSRERFKKWLRKNAAVAEELEDNIRNAVTEDGEEDTEEIEEVDE